MTGDTGMCLDIAGRKRQTVQTARRLPEWSRKWRLRQETNDGRLLTDGTAGCTAAAWTTTADGDDLAGLIPERADSDTVAPYRRYTMSASLKLTRSATRVQLYSSAMSVRVPDVKNNKWRLNPVCHRVLHSCTHSATLEVLHIMRYVNLLTYNSGR